MNPTPQPPDSSPVSVLGGSAFRAAALQSERLRLIGMLALILTVGGLAVLRTIVAPVRDQLTELVSVLVLVLAASGTQAFALARVRGALRSGADLPRGLFLGTLVLDSLLPAAVILTTAVSGTLPPGSALVMPAVILYVLIECLSVLRLSPGLCLLSGGSCGLSHLALTLWVVLRTDSGSGPLPVAMQLVYPVLIFGGGCCAAFVAWRTRLHLLAAISENQARARVESEIRSASHIQQSLMPADAPDFRGYQLAFWNRSADQTGGDYYDWQMLPDGRLAVTLADVAGHGLGPALVTAFCRAYSRATLPAHLALHDALRRVNTLLCDDLPPGRFITFAAVLLTPDSPDAALLSAGHGPIMIFRAATRTVETRPADSLPLGIDPDAEFDSPAPIRLDPGDALILVTDGFFEWANARGEQYGIDRLAGAVRDAASPADAIARMVRGVESFTAGTPQSDDLTAVVIARVIK